MDADWITSTSARLVLQHADDSRPAWLWSQDGQALLWHNSAADLYLARPTPQGIKRAPPAIPIKGQIARIFRLGSRGRTSLARIHFLAGNKPASATCATTPLIWQAGQAALLIVAVDPIETAMLQAASGEEISRPVLTPLLKETVPAPDTKKRDLDLQARTAVEADLPDVRDDYERELANWRATEENTSPSLALVQKVDAGDTPSFEMSLVETGNRLTQLVDQLAADNALFEPLSEADAALPADLTVAEMRSDNITSESGPEEEMTAEEEGMAKDNLSLIESAETGVYSTLPDAETVEHISRHNFDELSRLLTDRMGETSPAVQSPETAHLPATKSDRNSALINLSGETLVLNRLPLGILVFRDQRILFANRAITEMIGYDSVESLRKAGLAAMFPATGKGDETAGPVNHLVRRDGILVPVTARLQTISWQGRPALILSASTTEVRTGHEGAVNAFAQTVAALRGEGFIETNRNGVISRANTRSVALLRHDGDLEGRALSGLLDARATTDLRQFLSRPAHFTETTRPSITLRSREGNAEITLFAQGQAGINSGYFGLVRAYETKLPPAANSGEVDPALLARISRGIRRPLNTIIGFSDLIRAQAFGPLENERYVNYVQDIASAGQTIAALVDELDDYAQLRDGRYLPNRTPIALTRLLESCVLRIRRQADAARVILRNAISESLPPITADRASLTQAVLNLLASAIDQTPTGGAVVISAHQQDDGGIAVHVRDSSNNAVDMAERFVVFRDGTGYNGQAMVPVRSSVGLALTRSLLAVNTFSLAVDPAGEQGLLFTLLIPASMVNRDTAPGVAE